MYWEKTVGFNVEQKFIDTKFTSHKWILKKRTKILGVLVHTKKPQKNEA